MSDVDAWVCSKHQIASGDAVVCHLCQKKLEVGDPVSLELDQSLFDQLFAQLPKEVVWRWVVRNGGTVTLSDGTLWEDDGVGLEDVRPEK